MYVHDAEIINVLSPNANFILFYLYNAISLYLIHIIIQHTYKILFYFVITVLKVWTSKMILAEIHRFTQDTM